MSRKKLRWRVRVRAVQVLVAVGFLVLPLAAVAGWHAVGGTLAALKLGPLDLVEPAAALSAALAGTHLTWAAVAGILPPVVLALIFGPVFCSWICPWGLISELLDRLRFRGRRRVWPVGGQRRLRRGRALVLGVLMALSLILGVPMAALISAPRLITGLPLELIFLGVVPWVTGGLLAALLVLELVGPRRLWCRALCPVGTMAKYLRTPWTLTVRWRKEKCSCARVPLCQSSCAWGIDPRRMGPFDGCTNCMACIDHCPGGLLSFGFGRQEVILGWQGQTTPTLKRTPAVLSSASGVGRQEVCPCLPGQKQGQGVLIAAVRGIQATIIALIHSLRPCPCHPSVVREHSELNCLTTPPSTLNSRRCE